MNAAFRSSTNPEAVEIAKQLEQNSPGPYGEFWMNPEDIASAIVFLASDGARGIHGTNVVSDRGLSSAHNGR
jgi:NAD(P)-dependent dehydrogenase (short-subunit alcohol dehydrogenase family)